MSGYTDIDGSSVMAGSPDIVGCAEIELRQILGEYDRKSTLHRLANLNPSACPDSRVAKEYANRARRALGFVASAVRVLCERGRFDKPCTSYSGKMGGNVECFECGWLWSEHKESHEADEFMESDDDE